MIRDGRIPFGSKIECIVHKIMYIQSSLIGKMKCVILGNGKKYLVDLNYISEQELLEIKEKYCYFQICSQGRYQFIYDYLRKV